MNARLLALISRRPHLHAQHLRSSLRTIRPASPLIDLLSAVSPRDHTAIKGLKVGPDLGYLGARQFHTAEQALRWIKPHDEMLDHETSPAESWCDKRLSRKLTIDDLIGAASSVPAGLRERHIRTV